MPKTGEDCRKGKTPNWVDISTLVVLTLTLFGVVYYACQAERQASGTISAAKAAKKSADAAAASAAAWITVVNFAAVLNDDDTVHASMDIANVGSTPAVNARTNWEIVFAPGVDETYAPKFAGCPAGHENHPAIITGDVFGIKMSKALDHKEAGMVRSGTGHAYMHLCATYEDVFGRTDRLTEHAIMYPAQNRSDGWTIYHPYCKMR